MHLDDRDRYSTTQDRTSEDIFGVMSLSEVHMAQDMWQSRADRNMWMIHVLGESVITFDTSFLG